MRRTLLRKIGIAAVVMAGIGWLFLRTIQNTNAEPYSIGAAGLSGWRLAVGSEASPVLLGLQPPDGMREAIYQQIFLRTMVSLTQPVVPMPLLLRREYESGLNGSMSLEAVMDMARQAGLETARFEPMCVGQEQLSSGRSQQVYYAVFKAEAFDRFRAELARRQPPSVDANAFDPRALRPMLAIAASDDAFGRAPLDGGAADRCQAPLQIVN